MADSKKYDRTPQVMPSASAETKEVNGITITCDGNGTYTVSGTATADVEISFTIPEFTIPISVGQGGNGTLSFFNTFYNTDISKYIFRFMNGDTRIDSWSLNTPNRTNTTYSALGGNRCNKIALRVATGMTTNGTIAIMFTDDSQLPLTYQPYYDWISTPIPTRKLHNSTDTITTLPVDIYTDGQPIGANLVDISTYTASDGQGSKYEYFGNVTLSAGTYTFSCRQNNTLSSATRNTLFVVIDSNLTYESTATDYHLNTGLHSLTFTLESKKTINLGYWTNTISNDCVYDEFMLNSGSTALPYQPYAPTIIKGNMSQSGTPTPQNPITPSECGERTGNVMPAGEQKTVDSNGVTFSSDGNGRYHISGTATAFASARFNLLSAFTTPISVSNGGQGTLSFFNTQRNNNVAFVFYNGTTRIDDWFQTPDRRATTTYNVIGNKYVDNVVIEVDSGATVDITITPEFTNDGIIPSEFEPYGYKIPISSANTTTPVYLGEVKSTRKIGKIDLSEVSWTMLASGLWRTLDIPNIKYVSANTELGGGIAEKYTIHTGAGMISALSCIAIDVSQVSVNTGSDTEKPTGMFWYVLATETTGIVNEPIRKIGDYADTVSGITIPTITGKDTFDILTTLKPSEVELTYTGWHDASVQEKSRNLCEINGFISGETELKLLQTVVLNAGTYTYSCMQQTDLTSNTRNCLMIRIGSAAYTYESTQDNYHLSAGIHTMTFTVPSDNTSVELRYWINTFSNACSFDNFMLNTGSTALPYEPYWK